jgi:hypothetical protein
LQQRPISRVRGQPGAELGGGEWFQQVIESAGPQCRLHRAGFGRGGQHDGVEVQLGQQPQPGLVRQLQVQQQQIRSQLGDPAACLIRAVGRTDHGETWDGIDETGMH